LEWLVIQGLTRVKFIVIIEILGNDMVEVFLAKAAKRIEAFIF